MEREVYAVDFWRETRYNTIHKNKHMFVFFKNEESKEETLDGKEIEQQYENFIVCWVVRRIKQNGKREGFAKSEII